MDFQILFRELRILRLGLVREGVANTHHRRECLEVDLQSSEVNSFALNGIYLVTRAWDCQENTRDINVYKWLVGIWYQVWLMAT